jgi:hypothetical protein
MAKVPTNHGKHWTQQDVRALRDLAAGNTPTRVIGIKLGRSEDSIYSKASEKGINLSPTNQFAHQRHNLLSPNMAGSSRHNARSRHRVGADRP